MPTITVADAKAHPFELLGRIESGEQIVITRRGKSVAHLAAVKPTKRPAMYLG